LGYVKNKVKGFNTYYIKIKFACMGVLFSAF